MCDADLCCAKNTPALFFLHEEHGSQVLSLPFSLQRNTRVSSKGNFAASLCFADLAHGAHHGGMMEVFTSVLATCHRGLQPRFRNGQPNLRCITFCRSVQFSNLHGKIPCACVVRVTLFQRHRYFCLACCFKNCLPRLLPVAANEFHRPVHHHLWCIRVTVPEYPGINILPGRPVSRRERIRPAQIVPVIDVLLQGDQLHIPVKRFFGQSRQQSIRRRTARAALGCKQFDHYRCAGSPRRPRGLLSGWSNQRQCREQRKRSERQACQLIFHGSPLPPASISDFTVCQRLPRNRGRERFSLDNHYDSFYWLFELEPTPFSAPCGRPFRWLFPPQPRDSWAGDCPSISSTQLPQAQHCPGHTLFTSWSRRVLSLLSGAPSFWVCRNPTRRLRKPCS